MPINTDPSTVVDAKDFSHVGAYLDEYYDALTPENLDVGLFLRRACEGASAAGRVGSALLDAGCGPTMLYWTAFLQGFVELHGFDAREENIRYLHGLIDDAAVGRIQPRYLDLYGFAAARAVPPITPVEFFAELAGKVRGLTSHDMNDPWPYPDASFAVVTSVFGMECLPSRERMRFAMGEARRLLQPGGRLVLVTIAETDRWKCGEVIGRCLSINRTMMLEDLALAGFRAARVTEHRATTAVLRNQGYNKMLFAHAEP